jgi:hypothetical protein
LFWAYKLVEHIHCVEEEKMSKGLARVSILLQKHFDEKNEFFVSNLLRAFRKMSNSRSENVLKS